ncbi:acyltransferase family protein [Pseudomonas sp. 6D_7.1_Bac1]|uniref:acyltransferase family protein n=1 Tax=Pseudomonas sp. 6D_7.1_Bac1 TaxID=2971615 RepID=UPI0021C5F86B|nr:acyltransferase family protein [Pseudomonas sp. 6D_7.1_Bac1]MCU1750410.1 acyltransferase [Pseudomonas sp. 6D_7.1_Bac1]
MTSLSEPAQSAIDQHLSHPKYRPDIDGLRAIAVISVVAFHAFPSFIRGGFVGVDVFFVISGFLISSIIFEGFEKNSFSFATFYSRRVNRIFPALLIVLASTWALGWISLLADEYMQLGKHIAGGAAFTSNFVLLGEAGYFDNSAETKLLLHLWSLGIEEQFYLIWPLMVWAAWKARLNSLILIILIAGVSFTLNISSVQSDPVATFYSPQTRFWELLVGSFLAYVTTRRNFFQNGEAPAVRLIRNTQALIGLAFLVAAFSLTTKSNQFPGWWALLPTVGAALIIAAGPFAWINRVVLSNRIFVWVGLISFPLYLWHWPLLSFARIMSSETPTVPIRLAAVVASLILAWLTFRFVEKPIRLQANPRIAVALLSALLIGVGIIGYATFRFDGFPSRFPVEIQGIADFKYEFATDARYPECWLGVSDPYDGFAKKCLTSAGNKPGEGVLIWGDSHAARLYPGVAAVIGDKTTVLQATRSSCPPILDFAGTVCIVSNSFILSSIKEIQPHTVILFGAWGRYGADWSSGSQDQAKLLHTIDEIIASGIKNVIVLGPSPEWLDPLPKLVYKGWKSDYPLHRIPSRLIEGLNPEIKTIDSNFKDYIQKSKVTFVSIYDLLCNADGCMTHISGEPSKLTSWDYGHLTTDGSKYIAKKILDLGVIK